MVAQTDWSHDSCCSSEMKAMVSLMQQIFLAAWIRLSAVENLR
jgi:hypothetical protein